MSDHSGTGIEGAIFGGGRHGRHGSVGCRGSQRLWSVLLGEVDADTSSLEIGSISISLCTHALEFLEDLIVAGALLLDKLPELGVLSGE